MANYKNEMPKYIGTKLVQAVPMTLGQWAEQTGKALGSGTRPEIPGYLVAHEDGTENWYTKKGFEKTYRRTDGLSFGLAIEAAKMGMKIARAGWNGKNQYVELAECIGYKRADGAMVNPEHEAIGNKCLAFVGTSGVQMGWLASQADMLADDWMIVED